MLISYCKKILLLTISILLVACYGDVQEVKGPRLPEFATIGESKTILFIHGMYLTPKSWEDWEPYFQAQGFTTYNPPWPYHETSVIEQNAIHPSASLGTLTLSDLLQYYRDYIATLDEPPILIGHSMGGLIAQLLLGEGIVAGAVAIDSAPPQGVISTAPAFLKANLPHLNPLLKAEKPTKLTFKQFQFGFVNGWPLEAQQQAYAEFAVPESRRVGRSTLTTTAKIKPRIARQPLLLIAGGNDHTIPAGLTYSNFSKYENSPGITDYKKFAERTHFIIKQEGWTEVADYVIDWIEENKKVIEVN